MLMAADWMRNKIINSVYSALRKVPNIGRKHNNLGGKSKREQGTREFSVLTTTNVYLFAKCS
jgi:hypothetical protein